jgi:uncharacterized protein (TIGR03435 family)
MNPAGRERGFFFSLVSEPRGRKKYFIRTRTIMDYKRLTDKSPLNFAVCVPQVTGSGFGIRPVCMMTRDGIRKLNPHRGWLLMVAALVAIAPLSAPCQGIVATQGVIAAPTAATDIKVPEFDVVSVKQDKSGTNMMRLMTKPDGYSATNVSAKLLIQTAYGVREDLISGAPGWADTARFDFDAKVAGDDVDALKKLSPEQRRSMLQPALADRFKLQVHNETKQLPVFELVVAKGGSKLKEAKPDGAYTNGIKGPDGTSRAGMMRMGPGQVTGQAINMKSLVNVLATQLHQTVIDKTGLTGNYDLELTWAPDPGSGPMFKGGGDSAPQRADPAPDSTGPSIFTAIQEQLGLKLQSTKGPVETIVVDHIEMPSEN